MNRIINSHSSKERTVVVICAISTVDGPTQRGIYAISLTQNDYSITDEYNTDYKKLQTKSYEANLIHELTSYLDLKSDWDGYEGKPPKESTVITAIDFASHMIKEGFFCPKSTLSGSGAIGLYWEEPSLFAEIDFDDDGYTAFFAENALSNEKIYSNDFILKNDDFKNDKNLENLFQFLNAKFRRISTYNPYDENDSIGFVSCSLRSNQSNLYRLATA